MSYEIYSDKHLRVSRSGMSIKTGWSDNQRIVATCPVPIEKIGKDEKATKAYEQWLEDAEKICLLWNEELEPTQAEQQGEL